MLIEYEHLFQHLGTIYYLCMQLFLKSQVIKTKKIMQQNYSTYLIITLVTCVFSSITFSQVKEIPYVQLHQNFSTEKQN